MSVPWVTDSSPGEGYQKNEGRNAEKVAQMLKHFDFLKVRRQGRGGLVVGQKSTGEDWSQPLASPLAGPTVGVSFLGEGG